MSKSMTTQGPADYPLGSEFEGANNSTGKPFGDKTHRPNLSQGASVSDGLSCRIDISGVTPESLGMDRNVSNGKPDGPAKGSVKNDGASEKLTWG